METGHFSIEGILKEARAQVENPQKAASAPVVQGVDTADVEKFACFTERVGELLKLGQEPEVMPAVTGAQAPAEGEAKRVKTVNGSVGAAGEVSNTEDSPVTGAQAEAAPTAKVASWKLRMRKVATEMMQSDGTQEPGNVGLTAPAPDQTGFPDDSQKLTAVSSDQIERANRVKPLAALLNEPAKTSNEEMRAALPLATKSPATTAAGGSSKTAALTKEAEDEAMGRIAAHAFLNELTGIYGNLQKEAVDTSDMATVAIPAIVGAGVGAGISALRGQKGSRGRSALKGALVGGGIGAAGGGAALAGRKLLGSTGGGGPQSSYQQEFIDSLQHGGPVSRMT